MSYEVTCYDNGVELGTFDYVLSAAPAVGTVLDDGEGCPMVVLSVMAVNNDRTAKVEIDYL